MNLRQNLEEILDSGLHYLSDVWPDEWAEANMVVTAGRFPGPLNLDRTPYSRKILRALSPYSVFTDIAVMGGSQWGKTVTVVEPILAYYISQHPCNIGYLTGHTDLSEDAIKKFDDALDNSGQSTVIGSQSMRKGNTRSGDTLKSKEYPGGKLTMGSASNHKKLRQYNWKLTIGDDLEAANAQAKKSGSTVKMIEHRGSSYGDSAKRLWISSPELEDGSIIYPQFLKGDQQRWHIPCPHCGVMIRIQHSIDKGNGETAGFWWKKDKHTGLLVPGSVEYVCQECANSFDESKKYELNLAGDWIAGAVPSSPLFTSFQLSSLYSMAGSKTWEAYVRDWIDANPEGQPQREDLMKPLVNLGWGEPFKSTADSPKASQIQGNQRDYAVGTVPEKLSLKDGNGRIVLLTFASDVNGTVAGVNKATENDARLDYEIVAWSETGASYSVVHGSIGTFVPRENQLKEKEERYKWTYEHGKENSVWPVVNEIIRQVYRGDMGGAYMVNMPSVDIGAYSDLVEKFIDWSIGQNPDNPVVGVRGHKEKDEYTLSGANVPLFTLGRARNDIYFLQVGLFKDRIANNMRLNWNRNEETQPAGFMNYPMGERYVCPVKAKYHRLLELPYDGDLLYQADNFFKQYEAEQRKLAVNGKGDTVYRWEKLNSASQSHLLDCRVYGEANKEIIVKKLGKDLGEKEFTFVDYAKYITSD